MKNVRSSRWKALAGAVVLPFVLAGAPSHAQDKTVTIGYQTIVGPFPAAIADGSFEKATGYKISWRQFTSAGDISAAFASGDVPIGVLGSTGIAAATSNGVDVELFWVLDNIGKSEQLVARNGSGINKPQDLVGKKVAVPFVSTSHFHLLIALEKIWHIPPSKVQILNMKPPEIVAAWSRGDIDAAYVWPPALTTILKTGKTIITSEEVGEKSVPTFDGIIADKKWAAAHNDFMIAFTKVLAKAYADYNANKAKWTATSPEVKAMAKLVGGEPADDADALKLLSYPDAKEQASPEWLGGKSSKAVRALTESADFLKSQHQINKILPDYSSYVTAKYAQDAEK
ncbi:MAG TPA: taurine ABC transporter substrate-binding protein [Casimicrobiaceae bacterium]|nr:taurine ABC transporter substrate-binding protein [Casimicrobiaceae bacterium]